VGTAIGVAFDEALKKGETLAQGLQDPIGQFDNLREAAALSSKATEKQVAALIASGREAEAAATIRLDLARKFGDTSDFAALTDARDNLARGFTSLGAEITRFVAGPLTDFLNRLAAGFSAPANRAALDRRLELQGAGPGERQALIQEARSNVSGQFGGLTGFEAANLIYKEANRLLDERVGKTQDVVAAEEALRAVVERQVQIQGKTLGIIDAQAAGNTRRLLGLQRENVELQKQQDLSAIDPTDTTKGEDIQRRALEDTRKLTQEILALDRDRFASAQQQVGQFGISSNALERQLQVAQKLANISIAGGNTILRDNAAFVAGILENIAASVDRQQEIENRIRAAQIRGGERAEQEIFNLTLDQQTAAKQTELAIINGARELRDAGVQLRRDAEATARSLQSLRVGNLQFQTPQEQRRTFERARAAAQREANIAGVSFRTGGTLQERTRQLQGFADFRQQERGLVTQGQDIAAAIATTNQPLIASNTTLTTNLTALVGAVNTLTQKNWNVAVNVQGASGAQIVGDVVGAL
jgi:hypothetical protein